MREDGAEAGGASETLLRGRTVHVQILLSHHRIVANILALWVRFSSGYWLPTPVLGSVQKKMSLLPRDYSQIIN